MSDSLTIHACAVCGSPDLRTYHDQGYRLVRKCGACSLVFVDPLPSAEEKEEIERLAYEGELLPEASDFFANYGRDFVDDPAIENFRRSLRWIGERTKPGRILDVGPGTGIFLHLAREAGWEPRGIDICHHSADKARAEFDITVDVGDFHDFPYEPESFDCVTMLDVVEHTRDPVAFVARAKELLKPGGVLFVAVPNQIGLLTVLIDIWVKVFGVGKKYLMDRMYVEPHVYYFTPAVLTKALERAGFEVEGTDGENVYLGRYHLPFPVRAALEAILRTGSLVGLPPRVLALARRR